MKNTRPTKEMREYLDKTLLELEDKKLGQPDMYLVFEADYIYDELMEIGVPVAIFKNKQSLYEKMDDLVAKWQEPLKIVAGWYDDK